MAAYMINKSVLAPLAMGLLLTWCSVSHASDLRIDMLPEDVYPGQVVLVRVTSTSELELVKAQMKGQNVSFKSDDGGKSWTGLAGIDLDAAPGQYILSYQVWRGNDWVAEGSYPLEVQAKEFPVERITVEEKYVHLSSEDLARHQREKKLLAAIFGRQNPQHGWDRPFVSPVEAERGSPFGLRRVINGEARRPHSGADLRAGLGTPVGAASGGRVAYAGDLFFSGNTVILDHGGGLFTLYAHLDRIDAQTEAVVREGQIIGFVGATGRVTGPHLHWAAKLNGARVDPFSLLSLPLGNGKDQRAAGKSTLPDPTDKGTESPSMEPLAPDPGDESR